MIDYFKPNRADLKDMRAQRDMLEERVLELEQRLAEAVDKASDYEKVLQEIKLSMQIMGPELESWEVIEQIDFVLNAYKTSLADGSKDE